MRILASSAGWNDRPATRSHSLAPFTSTPTTAGSSSRIEAGEHDRVLVARQPLERGDREQGSDQSRHSDEQPDELRSGQRWIEPRHERQARSGQQRHDGEQDRVRRRSAAGAIARCAARKTANSPRGTTRSCQARVAGSLEAVHQHENENHRRRGRQQQEQFGGATGAHGVAYGSVPGVVLASAAFVAAIARYSSSNRWPRVDILDRDALRESCGGDRVERSDGDGGLLFQPAAARHRRVHPGRPR